MADVKYPEHLVFGLDIGTRSIVGTVGYKNQGKFNVVALCVKEHDTRAMMDGQIHDIAKVAETISIVRHTLEQQIHRELNEVCIAAAGRVLKTLTTRADYDFNIETVVTEEHVRSLDLLGVEKAYDLIRDEYKQEDISFYCVGYSVIRYYVNDYSITNLEGHKAKKISVDLLATFLPEEVINSLYSAITLADLEVANLTLEPIAAITVAIPEQYRLLNIGLVDVGAGTSDVSITKDGSIVAYGMIPNAGDELTDLIARKYLVDFKTAENIKIQCNKKKAISYKDIMGISQKVMPEEVLGSISEQVTNLTKGITEKIIELNGGKPVSAVFVVGGGGKIPGFTNSIAKHLKLAPDRVAIRGEEVLKEVEFFQEGIKKDSLLVTPIGICLNYYDQKNNFIFVSFNGERIKLYDTSKVTIADVALQAGFPNEKLFPRRGKALEFMVNSKPQMVRGQLGEAAVVRLNGNEASVSSIITSNDKVQIMESTIGEAAVYEIRQLPEYNNATITFNVNGQKVVCPRLVEVNNKPETEFYSINSGDNINILNYYTVDKLIEYMDVMLDGEVYINNMRAHINDKIYENFTITWTFDESFSKRNKIEETETYESNKEETQSILSTKEIKIEEKEKEETQTHQETTKTTAQGEAISITVLVNNKPIQLVGKTKYIFVDIFEVFEFDLTVPKGIRLITRVNGKDVDYTDPIKDFDSIEIYWKE